MVASATYSLEAILSSWRTRLSGWALDGTLESAARHALQLSDERPELTALINHLATGDFSDIPPIEVLEGTVLHWAAGAYAASTNTIYLNAEWLRLASETQVIKVLTQQLGYHLDSVMNTSDTTGDEGRDFLHALLPITGVQFNNAERIGVFENSRINVSSTTLEVEYSPAIARAGTILVNDQYYKVNLYSLSGNLDFSTYTKQVALLTHGWLGEGQSNPYSEIPSIHQDLAISLSDSFEVLFLDWSSAAIDTNGDFFGKRPINAAGRVLPVATLAASFLQPINQDITLIGHSLGGILVSEISRILDGDQDIVTLDLAYPALDYDLDASRSENQTVSSLSEISKSSLALVAVDSGLNASAGYGVAGDNPFSATADTSLLINYKQEDIGNDHAQAHTATRDIYLDLIGYLSPSSLIYKWLFTSNSEDPLGLKFSYNHYNDDGDYVEEPDPISFHEGVIFAEKNSTTAEWNIKRIITKDVTLEFLPDNWISYTGNGKELGIGERGKRISYYAGSPSFEGDFIPFIGGREKVAYDHLAITHSVDIKGSLRPVLANGFAPSLGDEFEILEFYSGTTGKFDINSYDDLWANEARSLRFLPVYSPTSLILRVVANDGVASASILGVPKVGNTISATFSTEDPDGIDYSNIIYRWQKKQGDSWVDLPISSQSLNLAIEYVSDSIRAIIEYTDNDGFREISITSPVSIAYPEPSAAFLIPPSGYLNGSWPSALAVDADGSILVASLEKTDPFLYQYSTRGEQEWVQQIARPDDTSSFLGGLSAAIGKEQQVYVLATRGYDNGSQYSPLIYSYSPQGVLQWSKSLNSELGSLTIGSDVAVGPSGSIYVAGSSHGGSRFFYSPGANLARYATNGSLLWNADLGIYGNSKSLSTDGEGNAYVVGSAYHYFDWHSYIAKYNSQGQQEWISRFGAETRGVMAAATQDQANAVAVGRNGNIFVAGFTDYYINNFSFDHQTVWPSRTYANGNKNAYVASYDSLGNLIWGTQFGSGGDEQVISLVASIDGGIYAAGYTGEYAYQSYNNPEIFIRRYDADGTLSWTRFFGAPRNAYIKDLAIEPSGSLVLLGATTGNLTEIPGSVGPDYYFYDDFLLRLNPDGSDGTLFDFGDPAVIELIGSATLKSDPEGRLLINGNLPVVIGATTVTTAGFSGYKALGVEAAGSGFEVVAFNSALGRYFNWQLDSTGVRTGFNPLVGASLFAAESRFGQDFNGNLLLGA